jgi:glycerophosphoryl diester phosphodiesterase
MVMDAIISPKAFLMNRFLIFFLSVFFSASVFNCFAQSSDTRDMKHFPQFYKEGHRGTRGLMPENTIPSMKQAIDDGANIIEVDIQISKDNLVTVAHDAYINRIYSLMPDGSEIPEADSKKYILYQMNYADIRKFDVGSKDHKDFPDQKKMQTYIPLFGELIDSVEQYTKAKRLPGVIYNIEIKSNPEKDGVYQPEPAKLIKLVMDIVNSKQIAGRFYIQSFDVRQIQEVHTKYPHVVIGFLTGNKDLSLDDNLKQIGFKPDIYSPQYKLASAGLIKKCHERGMKFVPWTVNTTEEMKHLIQLGVDGIITDYPNLLSKLK